MLVTSGERDLKWRMSFEDDSSLLLEALNIPATHHGGGGSKNDKDCKGREYNELFCDREQTKNHWIIMAMQNTG